MNKYFFYAGEKQQNVLLKYSFPNKLPMKTLGNLFFLALLRGRGGTERKKARRGNLLFRQYLGVLTKKTSLYTQAREAIYAW